MNLIIIAGLPATGKTTLSKKLAERLHLPILEKDEIKEELFETVGFASPEDRRALDRAANAVLLRCTENILSGGQSMIVINNFDKDMSGRVQEMIDRTGCKCVLIFLNGDGDILHKRYVERDRRKARHPGHTFIPHYPIRPGDDLNQEMSRQYFADRFEKAGMGEFTLNVPRIDLDATYPDAIDADALTRQIEEILK